MKRVKARKDAVVKSPTKRRVWFIHGARNGREHAMGRHMRDLAERNDNLRVHIRTGGVSIAALQIARAMGASVIATSSSEHKLERLRALGADHVINYRQTPDWGGEVLALTGGHGVDHVIEVGGPGTLTQSIKSVRVGGHIALIGILTGRQGEIPTMALMAKQARLQGLIVGSRRQQQDYVAALEQTGLRPVIDCSFPLEQLADAFRFQESSRHFGKIAVEW